MSERRKIEYIKAGSFLFDFAMVSIAAVFVSHLVWFPQMTIIQFMISAGAPIFIASSVFSYKLKKELLN